MLINRLTTELSERQPVGSEPEPPFAALPSVRPEDPRALSPPAVLGLQRGAGNAAVSRLMRREPVSRPGRAVLQRFVGSEHKELGDTTATSIDLGNGVTLSWGDVVALAGDEYATVEDLLADTRTDEGKARLRAALEHDGIPGTVAGTLPEPTPEQRAAHLTKYIRLAMSNVSHFPDGGEAIAAWAGHHAAAVETAVQAGLSNDPARMSMAYAEEAFGQHFLTDTFSGGHIRVPRRQIADWYVRVFAPRVTGQLLASLRERLINALVAEASPQTSWPEIMWRGKIEDPIRAGIDTVVADLGGMGTLAEFVGLGVAGAISGAMHDHEGEQGVVVASDDHPDPWRAYGDGGLNRSDVSREQATGAVAAAKAQVDEAYGFGEQEAAARDSVPAAPPDRIHFAFNSSAVGPGASAAVAAAAAYMTYRPDTIVDVTGHTDPIGSDADNDALGQARADAIVAALTGGGVAPGRVRAHSMGERALVTTNARRYGENRRADFGWATAAASPTSGPEPSDQQRATERAMAHAQERADPALVVRFVPRPVEERENGCVPGGNAELPDWHWGRLEPGFRAQVDDWIRSEVGTKLDSALDGVKQLDARTESGITVHPRDRAKEIIAALMANPTAQLGDLMGEAPGQ